jgi:threonyl-tRNA synthetase
LFVLDEWIRLGVLIVYVNTDNAFYIARHVECQYSAQQTGGCQYVYHSKEKVGYKIRQHTLNKVPFMIIIGANEVKTGEVNLRLLDGEKVHLENVKAATNYLVQACRAPDMIDPQQALKALNIL